MIEFDPDQIEHEAIRAHYQRVNRRGVAMARAIAETFPDRPPVRFVFEEGDSFNAFAGREERGYLLRMAKPVPYLLLILFDRLLGDPRLLPWLDSQGEAFTEYELPFVLDPADFSRRGRWSIRLTGIRSFASSMLADIAIAFIQMHELGHVLCGHVDANQALTGRHAMAEIYDKGGGRSRAQSARERIWESDADAVAAGLLEQYLRELEAATQTDDKTRQVFGRGEHAIEHLLALAIMSLFALFAYIRGARYSLRRQTSHPHPYLRAQYTKNMLMTVARRAWPLDLDAFGEFLDLRIDEMLTALEAVGLSKNELFDDAYIARSERQLDVLMKKRTKYRSSASTRSWIFWD